MILNIEETNLTIWRFCKTKVCMQNQNLKTSLLKNLRYTDYQIVMIKNFIYFYKLINILK